MRNYSIFFLMLTSSNLYAGDYFICETHLAYELNTSGTLSESNLHEYREFTVDPSNGFASFMNGRFEAPQVISSLQNDYPVVINYYEHLSPMGAPYSLNIETKFANDTRSYPFFLSGGAFKLINTGICNLVIDQSVKKPSCNTETCKTFFIQLASFRDERNAKSLKSELENSGFNVVIERAGSLAQVMVSAGQKLETALNLKREFKEQYALDGKVIQRSK